MDYCDDEDYEEEYVPTFQDITEVGECPVDSGLLVIVDPCYVLSDSKYQELIVGENVYDVQLLEKSEGSRPFGLGCSFSTQYGDGIYTAYTAMDQKGVKWIMCKVG